MLDDACPRVATVVSRAAAKASKMTDRNGDENDAWSSETAVRQLAMYVLLPGWFIPGLLDWWWHRVTRIEDTSGARESFIHALMMSETGLPILAALFLEINSGVLSAMAVAAVAHELTAMWDGAYATPRRAIAPREQHTHSFLEVLPFTALGLMAALYPQEARAIFGAGPTKPIFRLRLKSPQLPWRYTTAIIGAVVACVVTPYGEELLRCLRVRPTIARAPVPQEPPLAPQQQRVRDTGAEGFQA